MALFIISSNIKLINTTVIEYLGTGSKPGSTGLVYLMSGRISVFKFRKYNKSFWDGIPRDLEINSF